MARRNRWGAVWVGFGLGLLGACGLGDDAGGSAAEDATVLTDCEDAHDSAACSAANDPEQECRWVEVETFALDANGMCGSVMRDAGYCVLASRSDDGCGAQGNASCSDDETFVYYNVVGLEVGAVELFVEGSPQSTCEGPRGPFTLCAYDGATWDPPECACGCPG